MDECETAITPVLTVRGAMAAVEFYGQAFGAREIHRNTYPDGRIVAELAVGRARFRVADEAPEAANLGPQTLGGTTVRINLLVVDPDSVARQAIAHGATEVAPVADQPYGLRQGRLADPFGHHWLIGRPLAGEAGNWARQLRYNGNRRVRESERAGARNVSAPDAGGHDAGDRGEAEDQRAQEQPEKLGLSLVRTLWAVGCRHGDPEPEHEHQNEVQESKADARNRTDNRPFSSRRPALRLHDLESTPEQGGRNE